MKTKFKILILLIISIAFSCNSKIDSSKEKDLDNNSQIDSNCNIHNEDCEKQAKDLGMTLDEYHIWSENQQKEIEVEDAMKDENGDIVDPNSSNQSGTQKQWVNCKYCHGKGIDICTVCKGLGYETYSDGSRINDDECYYCKGLGGNLKNCSVCDGRGQVLMEY